MHRHKHALFGAGKRDHVVARDRRVEGGNLVTQGGQSERLGVAELQLVPPPSRVVVSQREQLAQTVRLDVGGAEHVAHREFPAREVALEREVRDLHVSAR